MTGINNAIEVMTRQGTLSGVFGAYLYAAFLVAGPWIFTVLGLFSLNAALCEGYCTDLTIFRSIVIYNSMYALVVASPLAFATGRYASEQLYSGRDDNVFCALVAALGIFVFLTIIIVAPYYFYATTLDHATALASIYNAVLIGCSWLLIPFLGAMRAYNSIIIAFGAGATVMFVLSNFLYDPPVGSFLVVFNSAFAITNLILLATIVRRFGAKITADPELKTRVAKKWELPAAGAAYALGLWIDKVIMWHADPSGRLLVAGALQTMPSYDAAMFWAQLSSIPIVAVFFVHVETRFATLMREYHGRL
jgi:uncharacterized membrane protein